jgi:DNA-binding MarR family transcriptional regulator/GNAT superfamily N-acetyltransferase
MRKCQRCQRLVGLTEVRVLHELARRGECTATDVAAGLGLDVGQLSRLLKRFEQRGWIARSRSHTDGRQRRIALTRAGRARYRPLDRAASEQVAGLLRSGPAADHGELLQALATVRAALDPDLRLTGFTLRGLEPGDIGWITRRQGRLYHQEHGWDLTYEALVAEILAAFVKGLDPDAERAWIAEQEGAIVGSVFLVRGSAREARLRLLYVEPHARGVGLGSRLVQECVDAARTLGYEKLTLWTNSVLVAARRIYEGAGFTFVREEPHHSFGQDLVGQHWELELHQGR